MYCLNTCNYIAYIGAIILSDQNTCVQFVTAQYSLSSTYIQCSVRVHASSIFVAFIANRVAGSSYTMLCSTHVLNWNMLSFDMDLIRAFNVYERIQRTICNGIVILLWKKNIQPFPERMKCRERVNIGFFFATYKYTSVSCLHRLSVTFEIETQTKNR